MPTASERNRVTIPDTRLVSQTTAAQVLGKKRRQQIPPLVATGRLEGEMVENVLYVTRESLVRELTRQRREAATASRSDKTPSSSAA